MSGISFSVSKVQNDVTGNWRISTIAENIDIEYYALDYVKRYLPVLDCFCVISIVVELILVSLGVNKSQKASINITHTGMKNNVNRI